MLRRATVAATGSLPGSERRRGFVSRQVFLFNPRVGLLAVRGFFF
jgi:hypothetical protein